ncbi:acyl-CoA/acyl-ACP dehydrogenase [Acidimicrobiia bacterium EGI L10123]|uniref:acyl-CoA dehydrogenase family protein n=1 Tax=Salinilacustrithrix flava TaxID=2957203 RepID=UPI003D7C2C87|nr:acyl-CoA/acyl-ACP dehydrogenase [Acidimicrobiia bacterium EGI L10123]
MDFSFTEEQQDVEALTRQILTDRVTHESLTELEAAGGDRHDADLYAELAKANLLGISLPEDVGGSGFGIVEQLLVLVEVGRALAPVPVLPSIVMGAMPIAEFGSAAQKERWVRPAIEGEVILTAALAEPLNSDPTRPSTTARRVDDGWVLDGVKTGVPVAPMADLIVVPASVDGEARLFLVEPGADGVTISPQETTNRERYGYVELADVHVPADGVLGDASAVGWLHQRATLGLCAMQLGITETAMRATAEYTKERVQFERPIGTFQAVGHRLADAYIDVEGIRLTLWQAAWRLSHGDSGRLDVASAKFWASEGGHRVAHAVVHLHGGMGVATEYFIHRYFIHAKQIEFMLGGATEQAMSIGTDLALELS